MFRLEDEEIVIGRIARYGHKSAEIDSIAENRGPNRKAVVAVVEALEERDVENDNDEKRKGTDVLPGEAPGEEGPRAVHLVNVRAELVEAVDPGDGENLDAHDE